MHWADGASIMQTSQLGQIKALEDKVCDLKRKLEAQGAIINNLVSNNLDHLQANMTLTQHINRLNDQAQFWNIESVLQGLHHIVGAETDLELLGPSTLDSGGDRGDNQDGGKGSGEGGAGTLARMRPATPAPRERGLIEQMEEVREAGLGGWFNGEDQRDVLPEGWSGPNSKALSSQDWVHTTELTTISSHTLPNLVRVPEFIVANGVLILLMEGLIRPYQCLIWANQGLLLPYVEDPVPPFWCHIGHTLIQIGPSYEDIDSEYGGVIEVDEGVFDWLCHASLDTIFTCNFWLFSTQFH